MDTQGRKLAGLVEEVIYHFGPKGIDDECCGERISPGEIHALRTVSRLDVCAMQDIARSVSVTKGGATRIVARLEDKGLAYRGQDQKDGRVCCVTLTEEGKALLKRIDDQLTNKMLTILGAMDPSMRDVLLISLHSFVRASQQQMTDNKG
ncbi:MAG: MarR family transcriptional regulator [Deltaproteobacteria bacterium]|nr:MarR family transcriptional regulator [Deltaproteobacteria bacterium]